MDEGRNVLVLIKNAWITEEREYQGVKFRRLHVVFCNETGSSLEAEILKSTSKLDPVSLQNTTCRRLNLTP